MEKKGEGKSLAVVRFDLGDLLKGVQDKKVQQKQQAMDEKMYQMEQ